MAGGTMHESVPVVKKVSDIYPEGDLPRQRKRLASLLDGFEHTYQRQPDFISRSPGRVNIIGEHIDYSLYEVLPMAIAADVLIAVACAPADRGLANIQLANVNSNKFQSGRYEVPVDGEIVIDASTLEWTNYFKSGFRGAVGLLKKQEPIFTPRSMQVLVDGTVPAGGGLSSSAAFVCASALAVLRAHGQETVIKKELVELAIVSERAVGVNSGGMDQAASVFSSKGDAVSVKFSPHLYAEAIKFPNVDPPITFMIAQSFVAADKHLTAPEHYNLRVVECTLAAEVLAAKIGLQLDEDASPLGRSIRSFHTKYFEMKGAAGLTEKEELEKLLTVVDEYLQVTIGYTRDEIASALAITVPELEKRYMTKFEVRAERFLLRQRAQHVLTEASRVIAFKDILTAPSHESSLLEQLGALMDETQASCRNVYECSCPEIDQLCRIAKNVGAYGSRLTGAGWGGCTVHLVPKDKVDAIRSAWEREYYKARDPSWTSTKTAETAAIVASEPGHGSMVLLV